MYWFDPKAGYVVCLCGQILGALAQPIFLSVPAVVSGNWFPVSERDVAVTVSHAFNPLGNPTLGALPTALPPHPYPYPYPNPTLGIVAIQPSR